MEDKHDASEAVLWQKRIATSNGLYVAARRFCREYEGLEESMDSQHWESLSMAIQRLRLASEEATKEVG